MSVLRAVTTPLERGHDPLEGFELVQAREVGGRRIGRRFLRGRVAGLLVGVLLATPTPSPANPSSASLVLLDERLVGARRGEVGLRLAQLLVDFGRFDLTPAAAPWSPAPMSVSQVFR
jgi:xanthosine utilization system XapX-like protein